MREPRTIVSNVVLFLRGGRELWHYSVDKRIVEAGSLEAAQAAIPLEVVVPTERHCAPHALVHRAFEEGGEAIYRFLLVRVNGDRSLADELLQQSCLEAIRSRCPATDVDGCMAWMFGITRNLLRRHWRTMRRERGRMPVANSDILARLADLLEGEKPPDRDAVNDESAQQLLLTITALTADEQALIFGFYFDGRSQAQLAVQHGGTEKSVEARLYRARGRLRAMLRDGKDGC